eukprot:scaffold163136_cov32-Tisochrysis_lutea.AAC.9
MVRMVIVPKTSPEWGSSALHVMRERSSLLQMSSGPIGCEMGKRKPRTRNSDRAMRKNVVGA